MKTLFLILFAFSMALNAQVKRIITFETVSNSVTETAYFDFRQIASELARWSKVDSITFFAYAQGEIDVDSVTVYGSNVQSLDGKKTRVDAAAVLKNFTATVNIDINQTVLEHLRSANAGLNATDLRDFNSLKIVTRGATSGNDPTDPNLLWIGFYIYGSP
jgi:hypothetical protein